MFSNVEVSRKNSKILREAQNNFFQIEEIVSGLVKKNFNENADIECKLSKKNKKSKSDKPIKNIDPSLESRILDASTNVNTKQYLEPTILPSPKKWKIEQNSGDLSQKIITNCHDVTKSTPFTIQSFPNKKFDSEGKVFVKIGAYFFTENTTISGLNQHLSNPNIFFLVSPCNGYLHKITGVFESDNDFMEARKQYGARYLADAINCVKKTHSEINCIVLGYREVGENMDVYDPWLLVEEDREQHIEHSYFPAEASSASTDVRVYNIDAHAHRMNLTSADLETLHQIADKTNNKHGAGEAIIVHCQQGLDRTGMLIFAFILYQNYDYYFSEKDRIEKIYAAYKTLQWSRSPTALTKMADFVSAIYLAQTLKAIDIEKKCIAELEHLIRKDNVTYENKKILIMQLKNAPSLEEKLYILECELKQPQIRPSKSEGVPLPLERPNIRPRSTSYLGELDEIPLDIFKKSHSQPHELHTWRGAKPDADAEKSRPSRSSGSFFVKKPKKELIDNSVSQEPLKQPEIKKDDLTVTVARGSSLSPITEQNESKVLPESLVTSKVENDNMKIKPDVESGKPVKSSSSRFSLKSKKRQSGSLKASDMHNSSNTFWMEFNCLKNAVQHRMDTEAALQNRIKPLEEFNITLS